MSLVPSHIHLFQANSKNFAFNSQTYDVAVLTPDVYDALGNEELNAEYLCLPAQELQATGFFSPVALSEPAKYFPSLNSICLIITSMCNMVCDYCFNHQGMYKFGKQETMTFETAKNAVDFLLFKSDETNCHISFFGGEPLAAFSLLKQVTEYAEKLAYQLNKAVQFHITTNATLITEEIAHYLYLHRFSIIVSIDGTESVHNCHRKFRGNQSSYSSVVRGTRRLLEEYSSQDQITFRGTYTRQHSAFADAFQHLVDLGFQNISIEPCVGDDIDNLAITTAELTTLNDEYDRLCNVYKRTKQYMPQVHFFHFDKIKDALTYNVKINRPCAAASGYVAISPNGTIYPCHRVVSDEYSLGNVNDIESLSSSSPISARFVSSTVDTRTPCSNCWARTLCGGSCYAYSIDKNLSISEADPVICAITKKFIEEAITLAAEEELTKEVPSVPNFNGCWGTVINFAAHVDNNFSSCKSSCTTNCQSSCTSNCTSGCMSGCTSNCTSCQSSCTGSCTSGCTSGCQTLGCTSSAR